MAEAVLARLADPAAPPLIMGVLNLTPDSFSDGGCHASLDAALAQARLMREEGASIVDVGGESTRPGAAPVSDDLQIARVLPVLTALRRAHGAAFAISVDTRSAAVAEAALAAGADMINDVSGARDPAMLACVARHGAAIVLMHMQGTPATMQIDPRYEDVTREVRDYLAARAAAAVDAGIARARIVLDPGIGFGKTRAHNLQLLRDLPQLAVLGHPLMLGTSRKRFMGAICRETQPQELVGATCATTALGVAAGVRVFRVHDVKPNRQALEVAWALRSEP
ncbi:MAG TPA: dihydropteroate synthase [Gammaproteobacteria bacterium]|nr:dihydropteroate synthase [Gammaproteobacteria bacterium]